jgi:nucleoside-diphosphate-sugar epimerase
MTVALLVLGCGFTGTAVARRGRAEGRSVLVTVRSEARAAFLREAGFGVLASPRLEPEALVSHIGPETQVVIAFPPDGETDARIAASLRGARAITYISSTGVYGERRGRIDDTTPLPPVPTPRAARILAAEECYRALGATVLRCPGIYGTDRGLHLRIARGEHRIPGDGSRTMSRVHVEDLTRFALAASKAPGETFVVGDLAPVPQREVVAFVCAERGLPLPASVPLEEVHETLRADRAVDPSRALRMLGVKLQFPSYREGMGGTG